MLQLVTHANGNGLLRSALLASAGVPHAFSTRLSGNFSSHLTARSPVDDAQPIADHDLAPHAHRFLADLGCPRHQLAWASQVHGKAVFQVTRSNWGQHPPADALLTAEPEVVICVRIADCVPLLLADATGRVVASVHAGWRGLLSGVIGETVAAMRRLTLRPLVAAIGPCIGVDAFEVGHEVVQAFERAQLGALVRHDLGAKPHIDLPAAATVQLRQAGLDERMIDRSDACTYRDADLFFSHRREAARAGRMVAAIAVGSA